MNREGTGIIVKKTRADKNFKLQILR